MNRPLPPRRSRTSKRRSGPGIRTCKGLCLALADWSGELRLIETGKPAARHFKVIKHGGFARLWRETPCARGRSREARMSRCS